MEIRKAMLWLIVLVSLLQGVVNDEPTNFNYDQHGADWPATCVNASLHNQSPINLPRSIDSDKQSYLFADFRQIDANVTIYSTTFLITPFQDDDRFGQLYTQIIKQAHYSFKATQIRIRCGSEHRIQQQDDSFKQYDLEIQIHTFPLIGKQNDKLVIGLLFQASQASAQDPFLAQIVKGSTGKQMNQTFSIKADLSHLLSRQQIFNFWFYLGSITYPPCRNKGMNWIVPDKIFKMSQTQLNFFKQYYPKGNWRDVQADKGNQIGYASVLPSNDNEF